MKRSKTWNRRIGKNRGICGNNPILFDINLLPNQKQNPSFEYLQVSQECFERSERRYKRAYSVLLALIRAQYEWLYLFLRAPTGCPCLTGFRFELIRITQTFLTLPEVAGKQQSDGRGREFLRKKEWRRKATPSSNITVGQLGLALVRQGHQIHPGMGPALLHLGWEPVLARPDRVACGVGQPGWARVLLLDPACGAGLRV